MITVEEWNGEADVVIHGDMRKLTRKMRDLDYKVDLTFTSPPYGVEKVVSAPSAGLKADKRKKVAFHHREYDEHEDEYIEAHYFQYVNDLVYCSDIVFYNIPCKQFERPFGITQKLLEESGIGQVIWYKPNSMPFPKRGVIYFHETIWVLGDKNKIKKAFKSVWEYTTTRWSKHPAPFPPELPATAINHCTDKGDIVFDPFGGSGTTAATAKALGRKYITCDVSREYCTWIEERLAKTKVI